MSNFVGIKKDVTLWADEVISQWVRKIEMLGIGDTQSLLHSLSHHIYWASNGDLEKITFAFNLYGQFVELGLGNRVGKYNREAMVGSGRTVRKKKPWCSPVFFAEVEKLHDIAAASLHKKIDVAIVSRIRDDGSDNIIKL